MTTRYRRARANELPVNPLPLERFDYDKQKRTLTAFESDLRSQPFNGTYPWLQRLYNDACDIGIAIRSHHTGAIERFCLHKEMVDREGDLQGWVFKPCPESKSDLTVTIFND